MLWQCPNLNQSCCGGTPVDELIAAEYERSPQGLPAYANDAHERLIAEVLAEKMPRDGVAFIRSLTSDA